MFTASEAAAHDRHLDPPEPGKTVADLDCGDVFELGIDVLMGHLMHDIKMDWTVRQAIRKNLVAIEALEDEKVWDAITSSLMPEIEALYAERQEPGDDGDQKMERLRDDRAERPAGER